MKDGAGDIGGRSSVRGQVWRKINKVNGTWPAGLICQVKCTGKVGVAVGASSEASTEIDFFEDGINDVAGATVHQK